MQRGTRISVEQGTEAATSYAHEHTLWVRLAHLSAGYVNGVVRLRSSVPQDLDSAARTMSAPPQPPDFPESRVIPACIFPP